ncbi:MAG: sigma-70 family RNA polymerase sigma factor [Lachnospiraceae bacterium]|nr:sigma-70 family RNA polymerase sigma factor [Lachnospiraceae bacterium]
MDLKEQYEKLLRYCYMLTKDIDLAEDIVQETYLRFWQSHTYKDTNKELAYLYTIARNLCMDEFRKPKLEDIDACDELAGEHRYEPEARVDRLVIEEALEKLPQDLKELIVLRFTNEMNVTDIAKVIGISRFAVHRRLKEGLTLLRKNIGGEAND